MRFVYSKKAQKQFKKLDSTTQQRIKNYTQDLQTLENPRLVIYAIDIAHRSKAY